MVKIGFVGRMDDSRFLANDMHGEVELVMTAAVPFLPWCRAVKRAGPSEGRSPSLLTTPSRVLADSDPTVALMRSAPRMLATPALVVALSTETIFDPFFFALGDAALSSCSGSPSSDAGGSSRVGVSGGSIPPGGGGGGSGALLASPIRSNVTVNWALLGTPNRRVL